MPPYSLQQTYCVITAPVKKKLSPFNIGSKKSKAKQNGSGVIDFGFVKHPKKGTTAFKSTKMKEDIEFIKKEVIGDMFIKPLFGGKNSKKSRKQR